MFALHKIYNPTVDERAAECREGRIGCVACKKHLLGLMEPLQALQERRARLAEKRGWVREVLDAGARAARAAAQRTLAEAKTAMGLP